MDPTADSASPDDGAAGTPAAPGTYRSEPYLNTGEIPVEDLFAAAAASAGVAVGPPSQAATAGPPDPGPATHDEPVGTDGPTTPDPDRDADPRPEPDAGSGVNEPAGSLTAPATPAAGGGRIRRFGRRRPKTAIAIGIVIVLLIPLVGTYVAALRKPGTESLQARTAEWARDMKLGFAVDWAEQRQFATDQFQQGGKPTDNAFAPVESDGTKPTVTGAPNASTTAPAVPHTPPPVRMASPVDPPAAGEGEWTGVGPLVSGLTAAYITKVRPDTTHTSLTVFVAWVDPKLADIKLLPGTDLPGGTWAAPNSITPEMCPRAIMASNGAFRMDQARGGYYAEGKEPFKLRDGAASLVFFKDGHVDVGQWGRDFTRDDLPKIDTVRQNLELMVDDGQPSPNLSNDTDWGAKLKNVYFMWRSGYGVTKDGALVYAGGPALTPADLARTLINAGAVRVMEGDINPEWVSALLYKVDPATGKCVGTKGLDGPEDQGGMRAPNDRYLSTDTRDFVAVLAKQQ